MRLYIQIKNGKPFEHPILEENLKQAFPDIDVDNLPDNFANFQRIQQPFVNEDEIAEVTYEWVDGIVKDVWNIRKK